MMGYISNIQRFSTQDGPGLRTTVFLKGCPLRCPWCHNMETWEQRPSLLYYDKDCVRCGACAAVCPQKGHTLTEAAHDITRTNCLKCGACARECPTGALELRGEEISAQDVIDRVLRDKDFYAQSGGGVTFSGGEVLMQFDFVKECALLARQNGLHVCLDTSGWGNRAQELTDCVDLYLWDIKHTDPAMHKSLTGVDLAPILESLYETDARGGHIRLRCPIIPGIIDTPAHMEGIAAIAAKLIHPDGVDLVPYHALGVAKSIALGLPATEYEKLTAEAKQQLLDALHAAGCACAQWK